MSKLAILVTSGTFENLNTAGLLASGAVANDNEVLIFFMNDSVWALRKDFVEKNRSVNSPFPEVKRQIEEVDKSGKLQTWFNLLPDLKDLGEIQIIACGLMTDIFGLKKEDLADFVDDIAGVAFFTDAAMEYDRVISL
ncbi:MAG: DsrE family protein [Candidatus Hodarchaeales archaeon]|jgi:peroxiredoxin family protein